jgi:hypothetical protein
MIVMEQSAGSNQVYGVYYGTFASGKNTAINIIASSGSNAAHTHSLSTVTGDSVPPYYALVYIMKI